MKRRAGRNYASQLTLFRGQLEAVARENANVPEWTQGCPGSKVPANNQPTSGSNPPVPTINQPTESPDSSPPAPPVNQPAESPGSEVRY